MNFFLLNLLAFFMHQILRLRSGQAFELTDLLYQRCYGKACPEHSRRIGNRQELWNFFRSIIRALIFPSWEELLLRLLSPPRPP